MNLVAREAPAGNSFMLFKSIEGLEERRGDLDEVSASVPSGWSRIGYEKFDLLASHQKPAELIC